MISCTHMCVIVERTFQMFPFVAAVPLDEYYPERHVKSLSDFYRP